MDQARHYVCKECSTPVPSGHKFCGRCGAVVPPQILELRTDFSGLEYTSTSLLGVDLNGSLRLDGELAVLFSGWLGDGDKNGVPGEALQLTFAGGQTLTLEEFLIDQFGIASLAAARLLLR